MFDLDGPLVPTEKLKAHSYARAAEKVRPERGTQRAHKKRHPGNRGRSLLNADAGFIPLLPLAMAHIAGPGPLASGRR